MAQTLLDAFHARMGDRFVRALTGLTGEYAGEAQKGADLAIQSVLDALIRRVAEGDGMKAFYRALRPSNRMDETVQAALGPEESPEALRALLDMGAPLAAALFGRDESEAIDRIAGHAGLKTSSAAILLRMATVVTWSLVKAETGERPGQRTLSAFLHQQGPSPAGIFPPYETRQQSLSRMEQQPNTPQSSETPSSGVQKMLPWIILILATLVLLFFVQRGCGAGPGASATGAADPLEGTSNAGVVLTSARI